MPVRKGSHVRLEEHAPDDVGGELLLSLGVLASLLPIRGGELEDAVAGPTRQEAQQIPYGAGALSTGIALAVNAQRPHAKVYACEVETVAPLAAVRAPAG